MCVRLLAAGGEEPPAMMIKPYGRYWAIYDATGVLACLCVL